MSKEVKSNAEFLLNNSNEYEKRAEENKKIFREANLPNILNSIADQELNNKHLFVRWGENNLSLILAIGFDYSRRNFSVAEEELDKVKEEGLIVFEAFLSTNNEIIAADGQDGESELGRKLPEGDRKKITDFINENIHGELKEKASIFHRKTKDTEVTEGNKGSAKNKSKRFNLFKTLSD